MERSVTLEAMGEYQQAMNMASKYANPLLIAKFRAFYESEINKSNTPTIASKDDWARDMCHFGKRTHDNIFKDIVSKLKIFLDK